MTSDAPELTEHLSLLDTVDEATQRLLGAVAELRDSDVPEPSLLPGWTRGHVLAHLARNADGLLNLLLWARTGIETPQYASQFLRDSDIEAGAPRPIAEQLIDLRAASDRWLALARTMPADRWPRLIRTRTGKELPATVVPWLRLREIEIHHVDLKVGYQPSDWPAEFVARLLPEVVAGLDRAAATNRPADAKPMTSDPSQPPPPSFTIETTDTGYTTTIGSTPTTTVTGSAHSVVAWLIGRSDGSDLIGDLPTLPAWL
ncbi:maleylpyruvate isomerase family mycothiol-dependent enzyme [Nocardia transvalensis]|uniref:maleylpyruvate isomerase family mycothiol-dependent enzyme n=1 Tax=Nocardia transvalensis TaxID=37333 RepID=UPI001893FCF1|nr:maleylpyruvate isomerase family mycothiol-dependent enzyme [Nocardia transvalensis]MBF6328522.1 maleylpyruvate isomerase family mycothiol-dependent enzyme [Nocardia transvalensis]